MNLWMRLECRLRKSAQAYSTSLQAFFKDSLEAHEFLINDFTVIPPQSSMSLRCQRVIPFISSSCVSLSFPVNSIPNTLQKNWKEGSQPPVPPLEVPLTSRVSSKTPVKTSSSNPLTRGLSCKKKYLGSRPLNILSTSAVMVLKFLVHSAIPARISSSRQLPFLIASFISKHRLIVLAWQKAPTMLAPKNSFSCSRFSVRYHLSSKSSKQSSLRVARSTPSPTLQLKAAFTVIPSLYPRKAEARKRGQAKLWERTISESFLPLFLERFKYLLRKTTSTSWSITMSSCLKMLIQKGGKAAINSSASDNSYAFCIFWRQASSNEKSKLTL